MYIHAFIQRERALAVGNVNSTKGVSGCKKFRVFAALSPPENPASSSWMCSLLDATHSIKANSQKCIYHATISFVTDAPVVREQDVGSPCIQKSIDAPIKPVLETVVLIVIMYVEPVPVESDCDNCKRIIPFFFSYSQGESTETFSFTKITLTVRHAATCPLAPGGTDHPCTWISVQHHLQPKPVFRVLPAHGQREQDEFCFGRARERENSRKLMILGVWTTACKRVATPTCSRLGTAPHSKNCGRKKS